MKKRPARMPEMSAAAMASAQTMVATRELRRLDAAQTLRGEHAPGCCTDTVPAISLVSAGFVLSSSASMGVFTSGGNARLTAMLWLARPDTNTITHTA